MSFLRKLLAPDDEQSRLARELEATKRELEEHKRATKLLRALDRASIAMASGLSDLEVYEAAGSSLAELGFLTAVLATDEHGVLRIRHVSVHGNLLSTAEKLTGMKRHDFGVVLDELDLDILKQAQRETVYVHDPAEAMTAMIPNMPRSVARAVLRVLGAKRAIWSPLTVNKRLTGMLTVSSGHLSKEDIPVMRVFSQQMSSQLETARLVANLQASMEEVERTQAQLVEAQKIEAVALLAGGVAHDFNNLLNAIMLSLKGLDEVAMLTGASGDVDIIRDACQHGASLVSQLLALAQKPELLTKEGIDVDGLVSKLERLLDRLLGEDIRVVTQLDARGARVLANRAQLEQVVMNLAVNARDAMGDGGTFTLRTALDEDTQRVQIFVEDTGPGIETEVLERIFEPFFSTKPKGRGTGLGLSAARSILELHQGELTASSEVGKGSQFVLHLPTSDCAETADTNPIVGKPPPGANELVLVIEDEPLVRRSVKRVLRRGGYRVLEADCAAAAREAMKEHGEALSLVFCDVVLPDARGPALLEELLDGHPNVRVMVASGYIDERADREVVERHGWTFLAKPYESTELLREARRLLR